jgi:hypothetical protein
MNEGFYVYLIINWLPIFNPLPLFGHFVHIEMHCWPPSKKQLLMFCRIKHQKKEDNFFIILRKLLCIV